MRIKDIALFCMIIGGYYTLQAQGTVSIYELGLPIRDYEDNFKNLVSNWKKEYITNAEDYKLNDIYFVETISGHERYNYYRNYFSSDQPVGSARSKRTGGDSKGNRIYEHMVKPSYAYTELYDTRGFDERIQAIFSNEFQLEARALLSREFNIDTLQLYNEGYYEEESDTTATGYSHSIRGYNYTSLAPFSQNYKDIQINHTKTIFDLAIDDVRSFILEDLLIGRITMQVAFSEAVKPGDRVYAIDFEYERQPYTAYVICSRETKKVIWDYFFSYISLEE